MLPCENAMISNPPGPRTSNSKFTPIPEVRVNYARKDKSVSGNVYTFPKALPGDDKLLEEIKHADMPPTRLSGSAVDWGNGSPATEK